METKNSPNLNFESELAEAGSYSKIIGFDEVGRGALAGPVYVSAVLIDISALTMESIPEGLQDSKLIKPKHRLPISEEVKRVFPVYGTGYSSASFVDGHGIIESLSVAALSAFSLLSDRASQANVHFSPQDTALLLDGSHDWLSTKLSEWDIYTRVKGDKECVSMAAASIIAKVERDTYMDQISREAGLDVYGWESNKGYGSKNHQLAISQFGASREHRKSWITRFL
jgi:ribonuclease HII